MTRLADDPCPVCGQPVDLDDQPHTAPDGQDTHPECCQECGTKTPPPLPDVEHTVLVEIGWAETIRVPIDGLTCPGCGTPLHECQNERGVLTDHNPYCPWTGDDLTVYAFRLARRSA